MIRNATVDDIPRMVAMGGKFAGLAYPEITFNERDFANCLREMLGNDMAIILVSDHGMLGALKYPMYFNTGHWHAQELFWWDEGGEGKALFRELERRLADSGVKTLAMLNIDTMRPEMVAEVYRRAGYRPGEQTFIKEL